MNHRGVLIQNPCLKFQMSASDTSPHLLIHPRAFRYSRHRPSSTYTPPALLRNLASLVYPLVYIYMPSISHAISPKRRLSQMTPPFREMHTFRLHRHTITSGVSNLLVYLRHTRRRFGKTLSTPTKSLDTTGRVCETAISMTESDG